MPFTPFKKGSNTHAKGTPKPTPSPAGPGGTFDPLDNAGADDNGDGIFGKPLASKNKAHGGKTSKHAFAGLKAAKP